MSFQDGYSIANYGAMVADAVRTNAYAEALRRTVPPGGTVLDIGAGPGILSFLACQAGAGRVYAVEPDDSIQLAQRMAKVNGYGDRIVFIQDVSTRITLPERVDVVVSDLHGNLPLHGHLIPSIVDARERHLVPGGAIIPRQETLWVAVVEAPEPYRFLAGPWADRPYGLDMSEARDLAVNMWQVEYLAPEQVLSQPACWATLDYDTITSPDVGGEVLFTISRPGVGHGLAAWFASELAPGVSFRNAPGQPKMMYLHTFFPWIWPVDLAAGDQIAVRLDAHLVARNYTWRWETRILSRDAGAPPRAQFRQSNFFAAPLSPAKLEKREVGYAPQLGEDGRIGRLALTLMDGSMPLGQIAQRLAQTFPGRFPALEDALSYAADLSERYSL